MSDRRIAGSWQFPFPNRTQDFACCGSHPYIICTGLLLDAFEMSHGLTAHSLSRVFKLDELSHCSDAFDVRELKHLLRGKACATQCDPTPQSPLTTRQTRQMLRQSCFLTLQDHPGKRIGNSHRYSIP